MFKKRKYNMHKETEIFYKKSQQCIEYNEFDILNKLNYIESCIITNNKQNAEILNKLKKIENIYNERYSDFTSNSNINNKLQNLNINKPKNISDKNSKECIIHNKSTYCSYIL